VRPDPLARANPNNPFFACAPVCTLTPAPQVPLATCGALTCETRGPHYQTPDGAIYGMLCLPNPRTASSDYTDAICLDLCDPLAPHCIGNMFCHHVEAAVRGPSPALSALGDRVRVGLCDVRDDASVRAWAAGIGEIDALINNAGVVGKMQSLEALDLADVTATFDINALGPIRVTRALLPALRRGRSPRVLQVTSGMGSNSGNNDGGAYAYRMSKAALFEGPDRPYLSSGFSCPAARPRCRCQRGSTACAARRVPQRRRIRRCCRSRSSTSSMMRR